MSGHLGDAISALLDGELTPDEADGAGAHLAGCAPCRAEHAAVAQARSWIRNLPAVEPPADLYGRILAGNGVQATQAGNGVQATQAGNGVQATHVRHVPRRRRRVGVAAMVACAAASIGVLGLGPSHDPSGTPPVGRFLEAHATSVGGAEPVGKLAPVVVPVSFRR